jgi:hypothetical protein
VITVVAQAKDDRGVVSVTFRIRGSDPIVSTGDRYTAEFKVPSDVESFTIVATALDADGNEGSDSVTLRVERRAGDLGIKITSPTAISDRDSTLRPSTVSGASQAIAEGETIAIIAEVSGTGVIKAVFTVKGRTRHQYRLRRTP